MDNCRNCGAASWSQGRCDYCCTLDPQYEEDGKTIAVAYFNGFISDEQRNKLIEAMGLLKAGSGVVVPANVELRPIEFVSSQRPYFRGY
jgi:hypothetical protein